MPERKSPVWIIGYVLIFLADIWSFMVLDMPNRLILRDTGKYWPYPGVTLFLANAAVMALFSVLTSFAAGVIRKQKTRK